MSLGDLNKNEDDAYRKIRLRVEDVAGKQVLLPSLPCLPSCRSTSVSDPSC